MSIKKANAYNQIKRNGGRHHEHSFITGDPRSRSLEPGEVGPDILLDVCQKELANLYDDRAGHLVLFPI